MNRKELRNTKVLLVDELDFLITKNQSVLYNLFEWPQRKKANLVIISVANTLDLPETFMARISSRIGNARLVFTPYTSNEIREIISQRVKDADIFDMSAINFISKKVALVSSDIRKTLSICRQTVERYYEELKKKYNNMIVEDHDNKITVDLVAQVFDSTYTSSPLNEFIKSCNQMYRAFLTEMYLEMKSNDDKTAQFIKIYNRYNNGTMGSTDKLSGNEMMLIVKKLKQRAIITVKYRSDNEAIELILLSNLDELAYSLKDDQYFSKKCDYVI